MMDEEVKVKYDLIQNHFTKIETLLDESHYRCCCNNSCKNCPFDNGGDGACDLVFYSRVIKWWKKKVEKRK